MSAKNYNSPNNPEQQRGAYDILFGRPGLLDVAAEHVQNVFDIESAKSYQQPQPTDAYGEAAQEALQAAEQTGNPEVVDLTRARLLAESLAQPSAGNPNLYRQTG